MGLPADYGKSNNPADDAAENHPQHEGVTTKGHFAKGNPGGLKEISGGKKRRARRRLTAKVVQDLWEDWRDHGPAAIAAMRTQDPASYVRAALSLMPKDITLTINPIEKMTDDRLLEYIRSLEEAILATPTGYAGAVGETEGGTATTIEHEEAQSLSAIQETDGVPRGGLH